MTEKDGYLHWERGENERLSAHFRTGEFTCHCGSCRPQRVSKELLAKLEALRIAAGCPLKINSGYRCSLYQAALAARGAETAKGTSQHELGNAADLARFSDDEALVERLFKAVGVARSFIHVDTRGDKLRHWTYVKNG